MRYFFSLQFICALCLFIGVGLVVANGCTIKQTLFFWKQDEKTTANIELQHSSYFSLASLFWPRSSEISSYKTILFASSFRYCPHITLVSKENSSLETSSIRWDSIDDSTLSSCTATPPHLAPCVLYPWTVLHNTLSPISKEFFCCKGSALHPPIPQFKDNKIVHNYFDCGGIHCHSLPIQDGKEYIYPILIELLNHIQKRTKKSVIITSGHRCPTHNCYVDASIKNRFSKHLIGAEVSFYVLGLEKHPERVIECVEDFYAIQPQYNNEKKEYLPLTRCEKEIDISSKPWMNKEIFIKYYFSYEGRDRDTTHPFPYFSFQVRFDRDKKTKVVVSEQQMEQYLRY